MSRRGKSGLTPGEGGNGHDARPMDKTSQETATQPMPAQRDTDRSSAWTFFRQWLKNPIKTASITPSGQQLAGMMVAELPPGARRVIELGGGTGVFTTALIEHGIVPDDLMVLELSSDFHAHLVRRFPKAHVVQGDARELAQLAASDGYAVRGPADAVISGLGMLSMPRQLQQDIMAAGFACLKPGGRFVQFTYGPVSPIGQEVLDTLGLESRRSTTAWRNLPPATVYVYTRRA
jgi:phosphatidylethanolamine/phosphatidyl-N-methylethanolamine N-methyltransferase